MSSELINRISVKKVGVYVSTHSRNDTSPYYSVKIGFLTKAYNEGGQKQLDKEIIDLCFYNCELRGTHKSILPYERAINKAVDDNEFIKIRKEYEKLDNKAFSIANRFDEYKNLTKEESQKMYEELEPELKRLREKRNEFVAELVEKERKQINSPKELKNGIFEIIPVRRIEEGLGEIYSEYMNFNSNNGTIIYEKSLGNLLPSPEIIEISKYQEMINKNGIENVGGAKEFERFIHKYPDIYITGITNEGKKEKTIEEDDEVEM